MTHPGSEPHELAKEFESKLLSDLTGQKEQTRVEEPIGVVGLRFIYTSVTYEVHKQFGPPVSNTIIFVNNKNCGCKK